MLNLLFFFRKINNDTKDLQSSNKMNNIAKNIALINLNKITS